LNLSITVFVGSVLWAGLLVFGGSTLPEHFFRPLSTVVASLAVLLSAFDLWLWRLPFLRGWLVKRPNLRGTWRAELRSSWIDPSSGQTVNAIDAFLVVRETYSTINTRLLTRESSSEQIGAEFSKLSDGTWRLEAVYRNEPGVLVQDRSRIHHGALLLMVEGNPARVLRGHYWTDRKTHGEVVGTSRRRKLFASYSTAATQWTR
jgi:SMODS-associating 2TM, beta-strand rich effector domain